MNEVKDDVAKIGNKYEIYSAQVYQIYHCSRTELFPVMLH